VTLAKRQDIQSYHLLNADVGEVNSKHAFVRDTVSEQHVTTASSCSICLVQFTQLSAVSLFRARLAININRDALT
jgi:hypothetical protein